MEKIDSFILSELAVEVNEQSQPEVRKKLTPRRSRLAKRTIQYSQHIIRSVSQKLGPCTSKNRGTEPKKNNMPQSHTTPEGKVHSHEHRNTSSSLRLPWINGNEASHRGWSSDWTNDDSENEDYNCEDESENNMESDVSLEDENIRDNVENYYVTDDKHDHGTIDPNDKITFQILQPQHIETCARLQENPMASSNWIAETLEADMRADLKK
ncbi:hypothetical protein Cgig2_027253 [Carnegiea gigantea]|uniref:Uncharacterized protein n=1 Tax=Carnegiea gigantea TaxID=171969 RepID=A0A9Q1QB04_9CARY|nr:hypothetical protein Cgig2_027253 [Carnegiea gigantea]